MPEQSVFASLHKLLGKQLSLGTTLLAVLAVGALGYGAQREAIKQIRHDEDKSLDIKNLIRQVKKELGEAEAEAIKNNELALFKLEEFEMEINYIIRSTGSLKAEVVSVGSSSEVGTEKVQKLRLRWSAIPPIVGTVPPGKTTGAVDVDIAPVPAIPAGSSQ